MKQLMVLVGVGAAAAAGYLVGDGGAVTFAAGTVAGVGVVALLLASLVPADASKQTVSLRRANEPERQVLRPGELSRVRERERVLSGGGPVSVRLTASGKNQIAVIKVIRNYFDVGLKEAKELSDAAKEGGRPVVAEMEPTRAQEFARDIEAAGGTVEFEEAPAATR